MPDLPIPDNENAERFDLQALRAKQQKIQARMGDRVYAAYLETLKWWERQVLDSAKRAIRAWVAGRDVDWWKAYAALASKLLQHAEAGRLLVGSGLQGDALALARNAISDALMLVYLYWYPEDLADWHKYEDVRGNPKSDKERRRLQNKFKDVRLRERIEAKGEHGLSYPYAAFSEAAHGSSWGVQYYGDFVWGDDPGVYSYSFGPTDNVKRGVSLLYVHCVPLLMAGEVFLRKYRELYGETGEYQQLFRRFRRETGRFERLNRSLDIILELEEMHRNGQLSEYAEEALPRISAELSERPSNRSLSADQAAERARVEERDRE
ncbi:MAG: hypothetical protein WEB00_07600 [Dehalococcoidia bacterium]